ncbi:MAG: TonB-dependent receptor [Bacteroidales bacterium]|nr:TonB-dependent receptor [Bacteroidales bacterium]
MTSRIVAILRFAGCCLLMVACCCSVAMAQVNDSLVRQTLQEVNVSGERAPSELRAHTPTQVVTVQRLEQTGAFQLSDALRQMTGLTIKDYGGIGGIKTISARGLGSQFSTLTIDGVAVSDCQNGQVDIGRYLVGNSAFVSFANGQHGGLLQSARAFAAGNILSMEGRAPRFFLTRKTNLRFGMEGGSYGMLSPSLLWEQKLSEKLSLSLWGSYLRSEGNYPYTIFYGIDQSDSSSVQNRENSQMWMAIGDASLYYAISDDQQLNIKGHFMHGRHNLPGAVSLYRTIKASEHTEDQLLFVQGKYRRRFMPDSTGHHRMHLQVLGKIQSSNDIYEDTAHRTLDGILHNEYAQFEGYLSSTFLYEPVRGLRFSLAGDGVVNTLQSNLSANNRVQRVSSLAALAAEYAGRLATASGSILMTGIGEQASTDEEPRDDLHATEYFRLSPFLSFNVRPWQDKHLRFRYFFKENYRVPTFNEMYYLTMVRELKPERAMQHNVGITYLYGTDTNAIRSLSITLDAYYNRVSEKIVAIPTNNMFIWSMINMGRVDITGVDFKADAVLQLEDIGVNFSINYSYQHAVDRTDPSGKTYGHQIPYTPLHSGGMALYVETTLAEFGHEFIVVGDRYCSQQNSRANLVEGYIDHGLSVSKRFVLRFGTIRAQVRLLNLLDVRYEVVRSYPMMGRNWRISVLYEF